MKKPTQAIAIALGVGLSLSSVQAVITPIPITPNSYTADVIVEKEATPSLRIVTTASVDQGTGNGASSWMEVGFDTANPLNGLPAPGTTVVAVSNANYTFQFPSSYTAPNGILINTVVTNGFLKPVTPATYTLLSFAGSGGNGGDVIGVRVFHQDGTTETSAFPCPDWFNGTSNVVFIAGGRMGSTASMTTQVNGANPRIYFRDMVLANTTSAVTNIELYYVSGLASSHNDVLAVSGATTLGGPVQPIAVTGWTYDFIVEASAAKRARTVSVNTQDSTNVWATTQTMENLANTSWTFFEKGYNYNNLANSGPRHSTDPAVLALAAGSGLPAAGSTVTNAAGDRRYTLAPNYTNNNAVYLSPSNKTATITLATPTTASVLSFLGAAGSGQFNAEVTVTHQDSSTETKVLTVFDWFNTTPPYVVGANGRVAADSGEYANVTNNVFTPRLFGCDILVSAASPVTKVDLVYTNDAGGRMALFALSGTTDPIPPVFVSNPPNIKTNTGVTVVLNVSAIANAAITYQWQKGTNGVFVNLSNGGNVSGVLTPSLTLTGIGDPDDADYRCVATTGAGSVNSGVGHVTILTTLTDVTQPTDTLVAYQPNGGSSPGGEAPANAINNNTTKYLNFGNGSAVSIPLGFIVTPSMGRTKVNAMMLYTANDGPERDPANVVLEGSDNGGASWTLITSNRITMPDGRNAGGLALDPIAQNITQVRFSNTNGYSMYRWYLTATKGNATLMQIGEVELLGVADTSGLPNFTVPPASVAAYDGSPATLTTTVSGTPTPGVFWLKKNGLTYTGVANGGPISGALTTTLSIDPVGFANAGDYVCVATNTSGSVTSSVATITVVSTNVDVTVPSDTIVEFGDTTDPGYFNETDNPIQAIDNFNTLAYRNGGSGLNAPAGFPPFQGPVGVIVTPSMGATKLVGIRVYTAVDAAERDPADYSVEGSNNGGTSYTLIASGALNLPTARADNNFPFDPVQQPMREILFANNAAYTSYRVSFNNTRDNLVTGSLQIGEVELLGVAGVPAPTVTISVGSGGSLNISSDMAGTLMSNTNLSTGTWISEGPISGTVNVVPNPAQPTKFYRVSIP